MIKYNKSDVTVKDSKVQSNLHAKDLYSRNVNKTETAPEITGRVDVEYILTENDRINIFVFDIYGDYTGKKNGGVYGYFSGKDMYKSYSNSNKCQVIFIDSAFLGKDPTNMYSTLAHEFQHLLLDVNKSLNKNLGYETWFTEMMSLGTEDALQKKCLGYDNNFHTALLPLS